MTKVFASIKQGLIEAITHAKGNQAGVIEYRPLRGARGRATPSAGAAQEQFAARFGFSVATLRHWERGDRQPHGSALVLLNLIDRAPETVMQTLHAA